MPTAPARAWTRWRRTFRRSCAGRRSRTWSGGDLQTTSQATDLAIDGDGFFALEAPSGETVYTRDGHFRFDSEGTLVSASGYRVSPGVQVPDGGTLLVGSDGSLTAQVTTDSGVEEVSLGTLELARFSNPSGMEAMGGNLFRATPASGAPAQVTPGQDGAGQVVQYALEGSNVDVAEELVNMITAQRGYELTSKVVQTADEMMAAANNLRR